jgi:hypothetical protein
MELSMTQVPIWVSALFIISFSTIPVFLIANAVKLAYKNGGNKISSSINKKIFLFYWSYFIMIALVSLTGFFEKNVIPPRIIVFTAIPLFIFYLFYIQKTKWFKFVFEHIKLEQLILIHLFRFVGVFFFLAYYYNAIPEEFAYIGGTGDILTAILVIPVVIALRKGLSFAKQLVWIWNIIGLLDILSVLITATILTRLAVENNESGVQQFGTFPFSWIPAFAPATIIFLHLLVFRKLKERNKQLVTTKYCGKKQVKSH